MANITKLTVSGTEYNIKDSEARHAVSQLSEENNNLKTATRDYAKNVIGTPLNNYEIEIGGLTADGLNANQQNRARTKEYFELVPGVTYTISCSITDKTGQVVIVYYDEDDYVTAETARYPQSGYYNNIIQKITTQKYARILIRASDNSTLNLDNVKLSVSTDVQSISDQISDIKTNVEDIVSLSGKYVVGPDLVKRKINISRIGTFSTPSYFQDFIIYNNKYYCIDSAGNLRILNLDFTTDSTIQLDFSHGNSMQLGETNTAYISGWDDRKIYVLNLDSLTITNTIELPSSITYDGDVRFSACVDDYNKIAYVFLRYGVNTTFDTYYTFFSFSITSGEVISRQRFPYAFNAIQGTDFYANKMIVSYGAGGTTKSGLFICGKDGTMLADFEIDAMQGYEPEGVFFDKSTNRLLITIQNDLYSIENY